MPANSVLVARDSPLIAGFSRISTRRSASSAVIRPPDSITSRLMSSKCQMTRRAARHRLLGDDAVHHLPERRHVVLGDALVIFLPHRLDVVLGPRGLFGLGRGRHGALLVGAGRAAVTISRNSQLVYNATICSCKRPACQVFRRRTNFSNPASCCLIRSMAVWSASSSVFSSNFWAANVTMTSGRPNGMISSEVSDCRR